MEKTNRYGLARSQLTPAIKREVRQRCGFGCIKCGNALIQYEHFDPPFEHAKEHNPNGITLLCAGCHDKKREDTYQKSKLKNGTSNHTVKQMTLSTALVFYPQCGLLWEVHFLLAVGR